MKKLSLLILVIVFSVQSFSQGLDFGIKAGVNFANITDATGLTNKTGFVVGVFAGVKLNDKLGVQGDLLYSQQGAEFDAGEIDLNYVIIPIVIKYYITESLNLQAGPQFGFVVDDNIKEVFNGISEAESFDLSAVIGAGFEFPFGIRVSGRYNIGLTDIMKLGDGKNAVATVAVGYSFL
ncbi:MAG: PorT family protein [Bacteroidetes bacterium]|nr:MAG: PorT family protein [Bacteroidota bacterium]